MKEEFFTFLKKHKCYRKWLKYTDDPKDFLDRYSKKPGKFLVRSFTWNMANEQKIYNQEDHNYWERINNLWTEYLKSKQL
jgi:hypothetical protein